MEVPDLNDKYVFMHFMRHSHARRMICALMHLTKLENPISATFYTFWSSPENKRMLRPLMRGAFNPVRQYRETLEATGKCDSPESPEFKELQDIATNEVRINNSELDIADLASPIITKQALTQLLQTPGVTEEAEAIIRANPNVWQPQKERNKTADLILAIADARYGDINSEVVLANIGAASGIYRAAAIQSLLKRPSITKEAAAFLDRNVTAEQYKLLSKHEVFTDYLQEKHKRNPASILDIVASDGGVNLPSNLTGPTLLNLYLNLTNSDGLTNPDHARAIIALHPNSNQELIDRALENPAVKSHLMSELEGCEHPAAEKILSTAGSSSFLLAMFMGTIKGATPEGLLLAANQMAANLPNEHQAPIITHPNFPWAVAKSTGFFDRSDAKHDPSVIAAAWLYNQRSMLPEKISADKEDCFSLFSESLSAVRIEKTIATHPEQAAWAACHPNGSNINVQNKHTKAIVDRFRALFSVPLAGKARENLSHAVEPRLNIVPQPNEI